MRLVWIGPPLVLAGLLACGESSSPDYGTPSNPNTPPPVATTNVTIANYAFSPANASVRRGTTVRWTNNDPVTHTATSTDGLWDSGSLGAAGTDSYGSPTSGGSFERQFTTVGSYPYRCRFHPGMTGTVTVTQ
ncbi:MAG TPA: plastocyanin/azurin family copper-binding protein [Gemmatimonadales bacterium]|nr:plastocyanin/azurin family copper-binding protein [Gemmatimonadales bacterium]